ncbi:MAG: glycosyltransferase family 39 protein [Candidatus Thorarchaeota archaeon]
MPIIISYDEVIFDEYWYIPAARSFIMNKTYERPEHPPLGQLIIASGILAFGDKPIGWRIFSLLFGVMSLLSLYLIIKSFTKKENIALYTIILLAIEKMFITFSILAVLDIYFIFFLITSLLFFIKKRYLYSSLFFALSANCKITAFFGIPIFFLTYIYNKNKSKFKILIWLLFTIILFFLILEILDRLYANLSFTGPWVSFQHFKYMLETHTSKNWDTTIKNPPWLWIINPGNYYLGNVSLFPFSYFESTNPLIIGLGIITLPYSFYQFKRNRQKIFLIIMLWTIFFYISWFPVYFIFSRPLFSFYILPTIPAICISNILFIRNSKHCFFYIIINIVFFFLFQYPFRVL